MLAESEKITGRVAILLAAERLFAEFGLHGASLRQISEAAGQKNTSAIHYHFGSREQLVEAVFAYRMQHINPKRLARLQKLKEQEKLDSFRELVSVMIWPLAEETLPRDEGNFYVQFLSRSNQEKQLAIETAPIDLMTGWFETLRHLRALLSNLPDEIVRARLKTASDQCVFGLASLEATGLGNSPDLPARVENLIDMIAMGLQAPVSAATQRALKPTA